jgi:hypothetical protein
VKNGALSVNREYRARGERPSAVIFLRRPAL